MNTYKIYGLSIKDDEPLIKIVTIKEDAIYIANNIEKFGFSKIQFVTKEEK